MGVHTQTSDKVAIKVLEKERIYDVSDVERVSREIYILKLIRHPNIIQLYEIIETPLKLYLIMEYASGGELFDYIVKHNKLPERESCAFFHEIIAGIEYIHKLHIVHRDLKPENLLLNENKCIKIVDFGLSNTYKLDETLKTACGSPCYAAPEMIAGKLYSGLGVDIWSAGVILFAMVCGYLPFEDSNTSVLYKKILAGDYHFPKFISKEAKDLLKGILAIDPANRFTLKDIRNSQWYKQIIEQPKPGILIGYDHIIVDSSVLGLLGQYRLDLDYTRKCLEANKHNNSTTVYYLLLKKFIQAGGVASPEYRPYSRQRVLNQTMNPAALDEDFSMILLNTRHHRSRRAESTGGTDFKEESPNEKSGGGQYRHDRHTSVDPPRRFHSFSPTSRNEKNKNNIKQKAGTPRPPSIYTVKSIRNREKVSGKIWNSPIALPSYRMKNTSKSIRIRNK